MHVVVVCCERGGVVYELGCGAVCGGCVWEGVYACWCV